MSSACLTRMRGSLLSRGGGCRGREGAASGHPPGQAIPMVCMCMMGLVMVVIPLPTLTMMMLFGYPEVAPCRPLQRKAWWMTMHAVPMAAPTALAKARIALLPRLGVFRVDHSGVLLLEVLLLLPSLQVHLVPARHQRHLVVRMRHPLWMAPPTPCSVHAYSIPMYTSIPSVALHQACKVVCMALYMTLCPAGITASSKAPPHPLTMAMVAVMMGPGGHRCRWQRRQRHGSVTASPVCSAA